MKDKCEATKLCKSERVNLYSAFRAKVENFGCIQQRSHLALPLFTGNAQSCHASWNVTPRTYTTYVAPFCQKKKTRAVKYRLAVVNDTKCDDDERG